MHFADLTDVRCCFELEGTGAPLLLIPGLGSTAGAWQPIVTRLADHFTMICPDNRGVGRSVAKRPLRNISHTSSDLVELLDYLDIERAHVLGVSLGGIMAQRFAVDHPTRIERLVLVSCTHKFGPYLRRVATMLGHTLMRFSLSSFARTMQLLSTSPEFLDRHPDHIDEQAKRICQTGVSRRSIIRQLRALAVNQHVSNDYRIKAPTLVLAGEYDSIIPYCYAQRMAESIPGSRFVLVRGAGHNPLIEAPGQMTSVITAFLNGRDPKIDTIQVEPAEAPTPSAAHSQTVPAMNAAM